VENKAEVLESFQNDMVGWHCPEIRDHSEPNYFGIDASNASQIIRFERQPSTDRWAKNQQVELLI